MALEDCEGEKSPSSDGFTLEAFKKGWKIIKHDILKVFNNFFKKRVVNACTNSTYICLIPKNLSSLNYRSISLVTSLSKFG